MPSATPPAVARAGVSARAKRFLWPFANREHLFAWTRTLSAFVTIQLGVQFFGLLAGLLIVRTMSKDEYAVYTVAGSVLGLLTLVSDLGVNSALLAVSGREWHNDARLGQFVRAALRLRWLFFSLSAVFGGVVFFTMVRRTPASLGSSCIIFLLLLCGAAAQLTFNTLAVVPRLRARVGRLQKLDLLTAVVRLSMLGAAAFTFFSTIVAIAINSISALLQAIVCRRWAKTCLLASGPALPEDRNAMLRLSLNQMPNILFYCFYSQLTIFVISLFGNTAKIAEVGALTRLGAIFGILTSVISTIILPRFARAHLRTDLSRKYLQVVIVYLAGALCLMTLALLLPHQLVWLLGGKYKGSEYLVGWIVFSNLIQSFAGLLWSMNSAKGWVRGVWLTIPLMMFCQILAGFLLDLSTSRGAVLFGSLPVLGGLPVFFALAVRGIRRSPAINVQ